MLHSQICNENYNYMRFFNHVNGHSDKGVSYYMEKTSVIVDLQVVQDLMISRMQYAYAEMAHKMEAAGIPLVSIPKFDVNRFGLNVFIIGFIGEPFNETWIDTIRPSQLVPMTYLPWFEAYMQQKSYKPTQPKNNHILN